MAPGQWLWVYCAWNRGLLPAYLGIRPGAAPNVRTYVNKLEFNMRMALFARLRSYMTGVGALRNREGQITSVVLLSML
jgi:hypothetical protein